MYCSPPDPSADPPCRVNSDGRQNGLGVPGLLLSRMNPDAWALLLKPKVCSDFRLKVSLEGGLKQNLEDSHQPSSNEWQKQIVLLQFSV